MIEGNFFDGNGSKLHLAILSFTDSMIVVRDAANQQLLWQNDHTALSINSRVGNSVRAIHFNDGSKFETIENALVDELQAQISPSKQQWLYWLENHYPMMIAMLVSIIVIVWLSVQYGIPASAKWAAHKLPATLYHSTGEKTLSYMDEAFLGTSLLPAGRQQALRDQFLVHVNESKLSMPINIEFRRGKIFGANAFALPSGTIVFTDELINMSCDDRELIAIFGHELGHIEHRHMVRRVLQSSFIAVAAMMVLGDVSSMNEILVVLPTLLLEMEYSRDFEREADDYALSFLQRADIELGFFTSIMNRLENSADDEVTDIDAKPQQQDDNIIESYFSTHPLTNERIKQFGQPAVQCVSTENQ